MGKHSHREKILDVGLRFVHEHGFERASVRDITQAAGVPQGSFTNHFKSKEAFGLEIIELYFGNSRKLMGETLLNDSLPPLHRLHAYLDANKDRLNRDEMRNGCLFGNFTAEASDHSDLIRDRLAVIFEEVRQSMAYCLRAAVTEGEVPRGLDCDEVAAFMVASLQGAILLSKAQRSPAPVERFKKILFSTILR